MEKSKAKRKKDKIVQSDSGEDMDDIILQDSDDDLTDKEMINNVCNVMIPNKFYFDPFIRANMLT